MTMPTAWDYTDYHEKYPKKYCKVLQNKCKKYNVVNKFSNTVL